MEKIKGPWYAMFNAAAVLTLIGVRKPGSQIENAAMEKLGRIESVLEQVTTMTTTGLGTGASLSKKKKVLSKCFQRTLEF